MVLIPEGEFIMGSSDTEAKEDEKPPHKVFLDAFYIDKHEVTNAQYKRFIDETGYPAPYVDADWARPYNWTNRTYPKGKANYPVVLVSWKDAQAYARWAGKRLPTEAEWEKAARGALVSKKYPNGDNITQKEANYNTGSIFSFNKLRPVGSYKPNGYGLYDMAGNVWEWCQDWYSESYYKNSPYRNPQGPPNGLYKVFRGGSWVAEKRFLRCSQRGKNVPTYKSHTVGFRCVLSLKDVNKVMVRRDAYERKDKGDN